MESREAADTCCNRHPDIFLDTLTGDTIITCKKCERFVELLGTFRAVEEWNRIRRASREEGKGKE